MLSQWLTWPVLAVWALVSLACAGWVIHDLRRHNAFLGGMMKVAWVLTVLYSGPLGLAVYWYTGRGQIRHDSCGARASAPWPTVTQAVVWAKSSAC